METILNRSEVLIDETLTNDAVNFKIYWVQRQVSSSFIRILNDSLEFYNSVVDPEPFKTVENSVELIKVS